MTNQDSTRIFDKLTTRADDPSLSDMQQCAVRALNCGWQLQFDRVGDITRKKQSTHKATLRRFMTNTIGVELHFFDEEWKSLIDRLNCFFLEGEIRL